MSKTFSSKSLDHLSSYSLVGSVKSYALSFKFIQILSTYTIALTNFANANIVSKFPFVSDTVTFADAKFDSLVLDNVDSLLAHPYVQKVQSISLALLNQTTHQAQELKAKFGQLYSAADQRLNGYKQLSEDTVSAYLKPVNEYASSTVDKVLPKAKNAAQKTEDATANEISKSIDIVHDTLERSKDLITSKSTEVSSAVIDTYNKEFEAAPENNYIAKVAAASVNTSVTLLKNVNSEYVQPLKETTHKYVNDTIAKADKESEEISRKAKAVAKDSSSKLNKSTKGAIPVVETSA